MDSVLVRELRSLQAVCHSQKIENLDAMKPGNIVVYTGCLLK